MRALAPAPQVCILITITIYAQSSQHRKAIGSKTTLKTISFFPPMGACEVQRPLCAQAWDIINICIFSVRAAEGRLKGVATVCVGHWRLGGWNWLRRIWVVKKKKKKNLKNTVLIFKCLKRKHTVSQPEIWVDYTHAITSGHSYCRVTQPGNHCAYFIYYMHVFNLIRGWIWRQVMDYSCDSVSSGHFKLFSRLNEQWLPWINFKIMCTAFAFKHGCKLLMLVKLDVMRSM